VDLVTLEDEERRSLGRVDGHQILCRGKRVLRKYAGYSFAGIWSNRSDVDQAGDIGRSRGGLCDHDASIRVTHHDRRAVEGTQIPLHRPDIISEGSEGHLAGDHVETLMLKILDHLFPERTVRQPTVHQQNIRLLLLMSRFHGFSVTVAGRPVVSHRPVGQHRSFNVLPWKFTWLPFGHHGKEQRRPMVDTFEVWLKRTLGHIGPHGPPPLSG